MVMSGNDSESDKRPYSLKKPVNFWKFRKTYPIPVKRSCMDEEQDGGSKPPISTKLTSIIILGFFISKDTDLTQT